MHKGLSREKIVLAAIEVLQKKWLCKLFFEGFSGELEREGCFAL